VEVLRFARALAPLAAIVLLGPPGVARPAVAGATDPPWEPPACRSGGLPRPAAADVAWFRLDAALDGTGTLSGQRLTLGIVGSPARRIDLPAESFASGPVHGVILVGDDDGSRSRLRAIDPVRGCSTTIATEANVVRGALFAPDLGSTVEHRVDRATRVDLGVWRRPAGGGTAVRLLPGLAADVPHGRTFATDLRWAPDGRLAVASCGELACRTRLVDPATGHTQATERTGPVLGIADARVIAYDVCPGFPCGVVSVDPASGATERLVEDAGPAGFGGSALVYAQGGHLARRDLRSRVAADVVGSDGLEPVPDGSSARAGVDPSGATVLLATLGKPIDPPNLRRFDPASAVIEPVVEVWP
jgi:hypothetical protein